MPQHKALIAIYSFKNSPRQSEGTDQPMATMETLNKIAVRQLSSDCFDLSSFDLPYTNDPNILPYSGIMFDLKAKSDPLEILTLEIDARMSLVNDFNVQVYTTNGGYLQKMNDRDQWTQVANTEAVPSADGSGIVIPHRAFDTISLLPEERISVYIHMKGPWIENRADARVLTAELAHQGNDFLSYAGVGTDSLFPSEPVRTTDPQFSGKVHYRKSSTCESETRTTVDLVFIAGPNFDHTSLNPISQSVQDVAVNSLMKEQWFEDKSNEAKLEVVENTKTSTAPFKGGNCPWSICNTYTVELTFSHAIVLSPGEVHYNTYRYVDAIERDVKAEMSNDDILYIGMKSAALGLSMNIDGLPESSLTSDQADYVSNSLVTFFEESIMKKTTYVTVFDSEVTSSTPRRNVRRDLAGSITLEGTLYGGRFAPLDKEEVFVQAQRSLDEDKPFLVQTLKFGSALPQLSDPTEDVARFFESVNGATGSVTEQDAPDSDWGGVPFDHGTDGTNDGGDCILGCDGDGGIGIGGGGSRDDIIDGERIESASDSPLFVIIAAAVGGVLFVATALYMLRAWCLKRKYQKGLEAYRKKTKAERKLKRLSKDDSCDTLRKDAAKALEEIHAEKGTKPSSSNRFTDEAPPESARPKSSDVDWALKEMREKDARKKKKKKSKRESRRDTSSLPDEESLRRARSRSRSSERSSEKPSLLSSFMDEEKSKRKPGERLSGTRSLDGTDFRRSAPSRAFSDGPKSHTSDFPARKVSKTRSADDLDEIRASLNRRNKGSPRSDRPKISDARQSRSNHARSFSGDLSGMAMRSSKSSHARSFSGDLSGMAMRSSKSSHARSFSGDLSGMAMRSSESSHARHTSADSSLQSRSAHARPFHGDVGTGLYGSAAPRRGTRDAARDSREAPNRQVPTRSQSYDPSTRSRPSGSVRQSRSGDLSSMRQSRSTDLSGVRDDASADAIRRGRRRDGNSSSMDGSQHKSGDKGVPRRTRSGNF